jgi:hypothetical protein
MELPVSAQERDRLLLLYKQFMKSGKTWDDEMRNAFPVCQCGHGAFYHKNPDLEGDCYFGWGERGGTECECSSFEAQGVGENDNLVDDSEVIHVGDRVYYSDGSNKRHIGTVCTIATMGEELWFGTRNDWKGEPYTYQWFKRGYVTKVAPLPSEFDIATLNWTKADDEMLHAGYEAPTGTDTLVHRVGVYGNETGDKWSAHIYQSRTGCDAEGKPYIKNDEGFIVVADEVKTLKAAIIIAENTARIINNNLAQYIYFGNGTVTSAAKPFCNQHVFVEGSVSGMVCLYCGAKP